MHELGELREFWHVWCGCLDVLLDGDILLIDLRLDLPSRLSFSLGVFLAAKGSLLRVLLDLLLDGDVFLLDGDVLLASVHVLFAWLLLAASLSP